MCNILSGQKFPIYPGIRLVSMGIQSTRQRKPANKQKTKHIQARASASLTVYRFGLA